MSLIAVAKALQLLVFVAEKPRLQARNQQSPVLRESWGQPKER
jgi:hypothetical protein